MAGEKPERWSRSGGASVRVGPGRPQVRALPQVLPPTAYLRVTEHVPQIITFIERLTANGHAYCTAKGEPPVQATAPEKGGADGR